MSLFYVHGDFIGMGGIAQGKLNRELSIFLQFLFSGSQLCFDPLLFHTAFLSVIMCARFSFCLSYYTSDMSHTIFGKFDMQ